MNKIYVNYEDINKYIEALIEQLNKRNIKPTGVYGIPRGGLLFALLVSYKLNIPMLMAPADGCIVIDDIADSGRTLLHFTENDTQFNRYFITTMYWVSRSVVKPDYYFREKKEGDWIVYPYEE